MRTATLTALFVVFIYAANAQLSLLPQVGFENSRTNISYNNLSSFAPMGVNFTPQAGIRLDYKFKQGHGPFLGITSTNSIVSFSFSDPENGMNLYEATSGNMKLRFEGGYQYSTKPIYFNKSKQQSAPTQVQKSATRKSYSSEYSSRSHCTKNYTSSYNRCSSKSSKSKAAQKANNNTWVRIQPSAGFAYIPAVKTDVTSKTQGGLTTYQYNAGNWNTGFVTGAGFEFGRNNSRLFTISINYFKGLGNLDEQKITTVSGSKTTITYLQSDVSGWNMKVGIPFTLAKKPAVKARPEEKTRKNESKCGQYRIEYKTRSRTRSI